MISADHAHRTTLIIGAVCGALAALSWAAGFVAAKHGVQIGFSPADIAFHRFFWSGLIFLPVAFRDGIRDLGGIGWRRAIGLSLFGGPPQALLAYTGFILVPLGHGTTIQPATAALFGFIFAATFLREPVSAHRIFGAVIIVAGLLVYGAESLATIGSHGVGGDLLFVSAGLSWAIFGTLLRQWHMPGNRAVIAIGVISIAILTPIYFALGGWQHLVEHGLWENLLQVVMQGIFAGPAATYLFAHAVMALGAGRAGTFPALVPVFGVILGYLLLGAVPSWPQLIGLIIVLAGFQFTLRR
ncbi:MAG: DMT family transporter [Pseudolabrys sp.]|nr:DMT family transporter [Pseudolabrys sp.]MBV9260753.1 DMT family transporter [Pseudolabrys sp.]